MTKWKTMVALLCVCSLVALSGCLGSTKQEKALELTVGGDLITAVLQAKDIHWYKVTLEQAKRYDFILKSDQVRTSVGAVYSVYFYDEEETQHLMWQQHYDPTAHAQLTDESTVVTKQRAVGGFEAPWSGVYYITVEGYINTDGSRMRNSYAYTDTLMYSVGVKFAATPDNPQGAALTPAVQAPATPYVNKTIEVYETVYHPVALQQGARYQLQKRRSDLVAGPWWTDKYGTILSPAMYFVAPYTGTFFVRVDGPGGMFGYTEYGLRVQQDPDRETTGGATRININETVNGYLGEQDVDTFFVPIPAKPVEQLEFSRYRVTITNRDKLQLVGDLVPEYATGGEQLETYIIVQGLTTRNAYFSPITTSNYDYLNFEPDGAGAYSITVTAL